MEHLPELLAMFAVAVAGTGAAVRLFAPRSDRARAEQIDDYESQLRLRT